MPSIQIICRKSAQVFAFLLASLLSIWMLGAMHYDGPGIWIGALLLLIILGAMFRLKFSWRAWSIWGAYHLIGLIWWLSLKPPAHAEWQADVAQTATADIDGDLVTFHHVRDFQYRSETDYEPRWIDRQVKLSSLTGIDIAVNYWDSPWMAHPIISFQFSDAPPLAFSIETRKRVGQSYSAIGGLYRQFALTVIVAEERDVLALRAVHRKNEDVYLYRTTLSPEQARMRLLEYIHTINSLAEKPRWYNAITTNCTTAIRAQHTQGDRIPWDWRILVNGKGDEMMYEIGAIKTYDLTFPEIKQRAHANTAIIAADGNPGFSENIRSEIFK